MAKAKQRGWGAGGGGKKECAYFVLWYCLHKEKQPQTAGPRFLRAAGAWKFTVE